MPRGRKKTDVAPQDLLNEVLASIEETEQKLKALRTQKKDIEKQIEAKEMAELYAIVKEKNHTLEEHVHRGCKNETRRRISLALLSEHKRKIHISRIPGMRIFLFYSILPVPRNYRIHADLRQIPIILILLRSTPRSYSPLF